MRVLEVSLRKAGFTVTTAVSVNDALDKLELHTPDLIISETTFPDGDGFELPRRVRATPDWADIPFIFLTAEGSIENKIKGLELGVDDYLTKPIYIKEIVTRINILLQKRQRLRFEERKDGHTRFAGRVADMPVVDVIQTIEISRKSGVIQFTGDRGRQATIYFRDGRVIDAEAGALQGEDAIYRLLTWNEGEFEVVFRTVRRREVITTSSQGLLMEGMRRLDEWSRLLEQLPALTHRFEVDAAELSARLGDVPDDNNSILRLMDGKRTLTEVIDASDVGDLECLQAISRLYFEELLIDLDHGQPAKRITGKPMPLVEVDSPSPIEDVVSGPVALRRLEEQLDAEQLDHEMERASDPHIDRDPDVIEEAAAPPGALMGGYRQSSLRLIDEAVAAAQAIEPSLFTDEELAAAGVAPVAMTGPPARPTTIPPPLPAAAAMRSSAEPRSESYDHEEPTSIGNVVLTNGANGMSIQPIPVIEAVPDDEDSIPHEIAQDEPERPRHRARARERMEIPGREDSGLRMIGSLGRDRAEASGELAGAAAEPVPVSETQRELVTILPRRITREIPLLPADTLGKPATIPPPIPSARTRSPTPPVVEKLPAAPPVEPPPVVSRTTSNRPNMFEGSGVSRNQGPGLGPILLFIIAALLGTVAVWIWVKKGESRRTVAAVRDAGMTVEPIASDAQLAAGGDAPPTDASLVALGDAAAIDATLATVPPDAPAFDRTKEAKKLMEATQTALNAGRYDDALASVEASLKLRKTVRTHLLKAQVLQKLDRVNDALDSVDSAVEINSTYAPAFELRGRILWAAGRKDEARFAFEQFLALEDEGAKAEAIRDLLRENR
jgi:DNA-binding response OmpR family regulator